MEPGSMISGAPKVVALLKSLKSGIAKSLVRLACIFDSDAAAAAQKFPPISLEEARLLHLPICNPNPAHPRSRHVCMEVWNDPSKVAAGIKQYECPECGRQQERGLGLKKALEAARRKDPW